MMVTVPMESRKRLAVGWMATTTTVVVVVVVVVIMTPCRRRKRKMSTEGAEKDTASGGRTGSGSA